MTSSDMQYDDELTFQNRTGETNLFVDDISRNQDASKAMFIASKTGWGKTRFCRQLLSNYERAQYVHVDILNNTSKSYVDGHYIREIAKSIDKQLGSLESRYEFGFFLSKVNNAVFRERLEKVIDKQFSKIPVINMIYDSGKHVAERSFSFSSFDKDKLFRSNTGELTLCFEEYIEYVLESGKIILNIENINCIDTFSLSSLIKLMSKIPVYLIGEYTEVDGDQSLVDIKKYFQRKQIDTEVFFLKPLSSNEALTALGRLGDSEHLFFEKAYKSKEGNIRNLEYWRLKTQNDKKYSDYQLETPAILSILNKLNSEELLVVGLLVNRAQNIPANIIHECLSINNSAISKSLTTILKKLSGSHFRLLSITEENCQLSNDEIIDYFSTDLVFKKVNIICNGFWLNYFNNIYRSATFEYFSKNQVLIELMILYLNSGHGIGLLSIFDEILELHKTATSRKDIENMLTKFGKSIDSNAISDSSETSAIITKLAALSHEIGLPELVITLLNKKSSWSPLDSLLHLLSLGRLGNAEKVRKYYLTESSNRNEADKRMNLCFDLAYMATARRNMDFKTLKEIFYKYIDDTSYCEFPEWAIMLKNAHMFMKRLDSLKYLEMSVEHARLQESDPALLGQIMITQGIFNARVGKLKSASRQFRKALKLLDEYVFERHVIYNNMSAIRLHQRTPDFQLVDKHLDYAIRTAKTNFDLVCIYNNKIISNTLQGNEIKGKSTLNTLLGLLENGVGLDENIKRIAYFNLANYSRLFNQGKEEYFLGKSIEHHNEYNKEYWEFRHFKIGFSDPNYTFQVNFDFHVAYLAFWHFPIDQDML